MTNKTIDESEQSEPGINWNAGQGLAYSIAVFFGSQFFAGALFSVFFIVAGWSSSRANDWLTSSVLANFLQVLTIEAIVVGLIILFVWRSRVSLRSIGINRPKLKYIGYGAVAFAVYLPFLISLVQLIQNLLPEVKLNQHQDISFSTTAHGPELVLVFLALVIMPPIAEEVLCRGFLYTSLRKNLPKLTAAFLTSLLFATAHLQFGSGKSLVWIAALDTFVLSMFLVYLREKTDSLWPSIMLHALKNGLAFLTIFIFHLS